MNISPATALLYLAIAALICYRVVYRQLKGTMLSVRGLYMIPLVVLVIGAYYTIKALPGASAAEIGLLVADLGVLAVLGVLRSATTKLSTRDGYAYQKGTALTLVLWVVTVAVRAGFVAFGGEIGATGPLTSSSIALSIGASIAVQNAACYRRARRLGLRIATDRKGFAALPR